MALVKKWKDLVPYVSDIYRHLLDSEEVGTRIPLSRQDTGNGFNAERRVVVENGLHYGLKLGLTMSVIHLGILLFDGYVRHEHIPQSLFEVTLLTCLRLAAKVDELDINIPFVRELNACSNLSLEPSQFNLIEASILKVFKWKLLLPTIGVFLDYFECRALSEAESRINQAVVYELGGYENALKKINEVANYLFKSIIKDHRHYGHKFSQLAAAIMAFIRKLLGIRPKWSQELKSITGYSLDALEEPLNFIKRLEEVSGISYSSKCLFQRKDKLSIFLKLSRQL